MVTPFIQFAPEDCAWCEGTGSYFNDFMPCLHWQWQRLGCSTS